MLRFPHATPHRFLRLSIGSISAVLITFLCAVSVCAQIFTGTGFTIVDGGARTAASCSTVPVAITGDRMIRSVSIDSVSHSWLGDLEVRVYPPGSTPPPSTAAPSVVMTSPPDGRACNLAGTYRFIDTAAQSVDAATVGCASATNLAPGDYRTSNYGGGTNPGVVTSLTTSFGARTPANSNGNWLVCVFDFAAPDSGTVGSTSIQFVVPSAASVSLAGRVLTADGTGIGNTVITMTAQSGEARTVITNPFGYYRFDGVEIGQTYILSASSKRYTFENPTVTHHAADSFDGINFIANP